MKLATWLWDTSKMVAQPEELVQFLKKQHVNVLYLQIKEDIPKESYQTFIAAASQASIEVHALDGAPEWAKEESCVECVSFMKWIREYQQQSDTTEKFKGIHLDVEPYLIDDWEQNQQSYVHYLQRLYDWFSNEANRLQLAFGVDIPFWFDQVPYQNEFGTGSLSEWVIDTTDFVTIMAYRTQAEGTNGIISLVQQEINWASERDKQIIVAIETEETDEPRTSFANSDMETIKKEMQKVESHYKQEEGFSGMAIHHLDSWMKKVDYRNE